MPGQEGIPSVFSPMARTLDDLTYFTRAIIGMQPWKYDHSVHPIAWRSELETVPQDKALRIGLMSSDGMLNITLLFQE
jgi:Asp-tRNA(Asn)/Glu-tRNA(Gln) amidotransferase A subunit family amidase